MKCKLDGIKSAKYSEGYELINASITFSLGEKSSLVLCKGSGYNYLKNAFS